MQNKQMKTNSDNKLIFLINNFLIELAKIEKSRRTRRPAQKNTAGRTFVLPAVHYRIQRISYSLNTQTRFLSPKASSILPTVGQYFSVCGSGKAAC